MNAVFYGHERNIRNRLHFPAEQFTGELTIGEKRVPVSLTATAGLSGKLELNVEPISLSDPSDGVRALLGSFSKPGIMIDEFGLDCGTPDGKRLTSDRAYLAGTIAIRMVCISNFGPAKPP